MEVEAEAVAVVEAEAAAVEVVAVVEVEVAGWRRWRRWWWWWRWWWWRRRRRCSRLLMNASRAPSGDQVGAAVVGWIVCQISRSAAVGVHNPDFGTPLGCRVVESAEGDLRAVGRPGGVEILGVRVVREIGLATAVGVHDVDLSRVFLVAVASEGDPSAVGRPRRCQVGAVRIVRKVHLVAAVGVHDPDVGIAAPKREKAIFVPSGDQAAESSTSDEFVRFACPLPSAFMTQIWPRLGAPNA